MARGRRNDGMMRRRLQGRMVDPATPLVRVPLPDVAPIIAPIEPPALQAAWEEHEEHRRLQVQQWFAQGHGAEVIDVNDAWTDRATAEQFALVTMEYALQGLYVAKEFCETALARVIRLRGRQAHLAAGVGSPYDLMAELHPQRMSAHQLKTVMQEVEAHRRADEIERAARERANAAFAQGDMEEVRRLAAVRSRARSRIRRALVGGRPERVLHARLRLQYAQTTGDPALIARYRATLDAEEARETFSLTDYASVGEIARCAHGDTDEALAQRVAAIFARRLDELLTCDDVISVVGLPDMADPAMMVYEVTGVRMHEGAALNGALHGVRRRGWRAFRPVRNSRVDDTGRITSWEADLFHHRRKVGTLRLSTGSGMLHLTALHARTFREPVMRVRTPRPDVMRAPDET